MATLVVESIVRAGLNPSYVAAAVGGDEFVNTGKEFIHLKNADASPMILTIETPNTVDGLAIADRAVTVPAGEERLVGPFPTGTYNDPTGKVQLTYDSVTTLTIGLFKTS